MQIKTRIHDNVNLHEVAKLTHAARQSIVKRENLTPDAIADRFQNFLSQNPTKIVTAHAGERLIGCLFLYIRSATLLEMNPGQILGGHPVVAPELDKWAVADCLFQEAIAWANQEDFEKIELITPIDDDETIFHSLYEQHKFNIEISYVEMLCRLSEQSLPTPSHPAGFVVKPITHVSKDALFQCYYNAFSSGDASFFFAQSESERREYFDSLGYEATIVEPTSLTLMENQQLIGFSFVLPYGDANCHISCMCIEPEFRRKGLGEFMLHTIMQKAPQQGYQTITLGTDTSMAAFKLYEKNGFKIMDGSLIWHRSLQ